MTRRATKAKNIILSKDERDYLERLVRRRKVSRGEGQRAEIVLRAADGLNNRAISDAVGVARDTVRMWRERFAKHGLDGLDDEPRCGAPRQIGDDRIEEIITMTLETKPADATHWSTPGMAKASGVGHIFLAAASRRDVQTFDRSAVRRESMRYREALSGST